MFLPLYAVSLQWWVIMALHSSQSFAFLTFFFFYVIYSNPCTSDHILKLFLYLIRCFFLYILLSVSEYQRFKALFFNMSMSELTLSHHQLG